MRCRRQLAMAALTAVTTLSSLEPATMMASAQLVSDHDADDPKLELAAGVRE